MVQRCAHIGAAGFLLGLALAGPVAVASADTDAGSAAVSASQPAAKTTAHPVRRAAAPAKAPEARNTRTGRPSTTPKIAAARAAASIPAPAAVRRTVRVAQAAQPAETAPAAPEVAVPKPAKTAAAAQPIAVAVDQFLTNTATKLATLPSNPLTDLAQGGLYLVRRTLFPASVGVITKPIEVPLHFATIDKDGVQKVGIYAALGGSATPQLFEFDTGGNGFYAAYASVDTKVNSPWWGPAVTTNGQTVTNSYDSGLVYTGLVASTTVALFAAPDSPTALLASRQVGVGQIDSIAKGSETYWGPDGSTTPPVDNAFWGDFGLSPVYSDKGIADVVAQLRYARGVSPGYRIHIDPKTQTAWMQVGLTSADLQAPGGLYFDMLPDTAAPTGAVARYGGVRYYGLSKEGQQLFTSTINIVGDTPGITNDGVGVTPDTGASTTLHNTNLSPSPKEYDSITKWKDDDKTTGRLDVDKNLEFFLSTPADEDFFKFAVTNEPDYGRVDVQNNNPKRPTYYLNTGISLFYTYDVVYSLGDPVASIVGPQGVLGLIPRS